MVEDMVCGWDILYGRVCACRWSWRCRRYRLISPALEAGRRSSYDPRRALMLTVDACYGFQTGCVDSSGLRRAVSVRTSSRLWRGFQSPPNASFCMLILFVSDLTRWRVSDAFSPELHISSKCTRRQHDGPRHLQGWLQDRPTSPVLPSPTLPPLWRCRRYRLWIARMGRGSLDRTRACCE